MFFSKTNFVHDLRIVKQFFPFSNSNAVRGIMSSDSDKEEKKMTTRKTAAIPIKQIPTWPEYLNEGATFMDKTIQKVERVDRDLASKVSIWQGDITQLELDAIVNAANSSLLGGGGVDGAIHKAAGLGLRKECSALGGCQVGEAKITGGYSLPAKHVIHTVGPRGERPDKLRECYNNTLALAKENGLRTLAFPCVSTGIYGYPQEAAADVAISTVKKFLLDNKTDMDRIIFCLFLDTDKEIYQRLLQKYFSFK